MKNMKRKVKSITYILMLCLMLTAITGCSNSKSNSKTDGEGSTTDEKTINQEDDTTTVETIGDKLNADDMFTGRDKEVGYETSGSIEIALKGSKAECSSKAVKIEDKRITIGDKGVYILSGTWDNGQIVVDAGKQDKIQLVLNGVDINCDTSAAIYIKQADKVFITLEKDTKNRLGNKAEFVAIDDNNIDAVIFSKEDITLNGLGSLSIGAVYGHGIVSKDDLVITSGTYSITAQKHGLSGKDSVRIADGNFTITSGKDGIHAENADDSNSGFFYMAGGELQIEAETDGIDAASILQIDGGSLNLVTGGGSKNASVKDGSFNDDWGNWGKGGKMDRKNGQQQGLTETANITDNANATENKEAIGNSTETSSAKGLKAEGNLFIQGGEITIDSSDDSIHTNGNFSIDGGTCTLTSGDDGMHADNALMISGGTVEIKKSYEGIEAQTIDIKDGSITLTASDDGFNAAGGNDQSSMNGRPGMNEFEADENCWIRIEGGVIHVDAAGDGVDSNGNLYVTGGATYVSGPENSGNGAMDYAGEAQITGGIFVATGMSGMAQNFGSNSTQGSMLVNVSTQSGAKLQLKDASGETLVSFTSEKKFDSVVISTPSIKKGETYILEVGEESVKVEMTDLIYGEGNGMGGMGQPGGHGNGDGRDNDGGRGGMRGNMPNSKPDGNMPDNGNISGDGNGKEMPIT